MDDCEIFEAAFRAQAQEIQPPPSEISSQPSPEEEARRLEREAKKQARLWAKKAQELIDAQDPQEDDTYDFDDWDEQLDRGEKKRAKVQAQRKEIKDNKPRK